jgi:hypothetical protein
MLKRMCSIIGATLGGTWSAMRVGLALPLLLTGCAMVDTEPPMIDIWYLNPTADVVDLRTQSRQPNSNGGTTGDVPPCDIGGASWTLGEQQTWNVTADGVMVLDSTAVLPEPGLGQVLEVVIARRPDGTHAVQSAGVRRPLTDSQSSERYQELRSGFDC